MTFLSRLQRSPWLNQAVNIARLDRFADFFLSRYSIRRSFLLEYVYQITSIASLVAAGEVFRSPTYQLPVSRIQPQTFIDLGANAGFFPVLVAALVKNRAVEGLI